MEMTLERTKKNLNHYKEATAAAEENLKQVRAWNETYARNNHEIGII